MSLVDNWEEEPVVPEDPTDPVDPVEQETTDDESTKVNKPKGVKK